MRIINYNPAAIEQEISKNKRNVFKFFARYSLDVPRAFFVFGIFALLLCCALYLTYENTFLLFALCITAVSSCVFGILATIVFFASDDGPQPKDFRKWFHRYVSKRNIICVYRTNYGKASRLEFAFENPDGSVHYIVSLPPWYPFPNIQISIRRFWIYLQEG